MRFSQFAICHSPQGYITAKGPKKGIEKKKKKMCQTVIGFHLVAVFLFFKVFISPSKRLPYPVYSVAA